jgi:hypothetical protein
VKNLFEKLKELKRNKQKKIKEEQDERRRIAKGLRPGQVAEENLTNMHAPKFQFV